MLYWILKHYAPLLEHLEIRAAGDSTTLLTLRTALSTVTAFLFAIILGPYAIRWLKTRFTEKIKSGSPKLDELHQQKQSTPTMGGLFICGAILASSLLFGDLTSQYVQAALAMILTYALIGGYDDWIKLTTHKKGMSARTKFSLQIIVTTLILFLLAPTLKSTTVGTHLVFPVGNLSWELGYFFLPWGLIVVTGASNAVNLTDGLDGLASGCMLFVTGTILIVSYLAGHKVLAEYLQIPYISGSGELTVILGAVLGAVLGFLWFNCYPAAVFMGDIGSLPLGAILGFSALVIHQEILLLIAGGMLVIETLSVMLQVGYFKFTRKRILACSPLHNHYVFQGLNEHKIVIRFWIASAIFAICSLITLRIP